MAGDSGPRFAPPDPSLPPPWRALVDGNTGYIYYWNTETNATQYDKPHAQLGHPPLPPGPPPGPGAVPNAHTPKIASEAVRASPRASADVQSTRHAERDFDNGRLPAGSQTRGGPVGHQRGSHGSRFSGSSGSSNPSNPSGSAAGNVYLQSSIHTPSHMVSSTPRSGPSLSPRVAKSGPAIPSHAPRTGSGMSGEVPRSGSAVSFGASRSGPGLSSAGGRINARDSQWGNTAGRDSQWGSAGGKDGHWGGSGGRDSQWGGSGDRDSQLGGRVSQWGGSGSRDNQWGSSAKEGQWGSNAKEGQWGGSAKDSQWGSSSGRDSQWDSSGGRDSQWGSSKQAYHSSGGSRGGSGGSMHGGGAKSIQADPRGHAPMQPKLASVPIQHRHQDLDGLHHSAQSRHISQSILPAGGRSPLATALTKRSASEYLSSPDLHKRPRLQAFAEPPFTLDVESYRRQHEITVVGENVPAPIMTFDAAVFPIEILRELRSAGFLTPTPIQAQSWPIALQKRDVVAIAKTGSGKTLGYLLPGFLHLLQRGANSQSGPIVLVLAPTRELATQIHDEAVKFGRSSRISSTCVYGGASKGHQLRELEKGADIVIATPGRLNDFLEMRKISLRQVSYLVLDEADRMLDMGFEPQIRKIVKEVPLRRQTLMFTATWPREVRKIAADLLTHAVQVNIGNSDELTTNKAITQHVELVQPYEKQRRLEQILRSQEPGSKILIFCSTKKMCDQLARSLGRGFKAAAIHGDKSQVERDNVLAQFKAGRSPILVATDVAARGLDVKDIRVVINFDFPTGVEDYVHRIGRTGRAGATGVAFTFFSEQDFKYARELVKILESANQVVPLELRQLANRFPQARGRGGRWNSGSVSVRDESRERRDASAGIHEGGVVGRDGGGGFREAGVGLRDGSLGPTDMSRGGGMGSRGGAMGGKDASINGRFGSLTSRMGIPDVKDVAVGTRPESMGGRGGGVSGRAGPLGGRGRVMGARDVDVYGPGGDGWNDTGASDGWVEAGRGDVPYGDVWGRLGGGEWAEGRSDANRSVSGRGGHTDRTGVAFGSRESRFGNLDKGHTRFRDDSAGKNDGWGEHVHGWSSLKSDSGWADTSGRGVSSKDFDRQDKITGSAMDRTKFSSKITVSSEVRHERSHSQDEFKKSAARERGHNSRSSHSRSPSKGWGRSRSRSPAGGWDRGHSPAGGWGRSRSPAGGWVRSRSPPGGGWGRSLSPSGGWGRSGSPRKGTGRSRSPSRSRSPHKAYKSEHGGTASNRNKALHRGFSPPSHQVSPPAGKLERAGVEIVSATEGESSPSVKDNEIPSQGTVQIADFKHEIDSSIHAAEQPTEQLLEDTKLSFARHSGELGQAEEPQFSGQATATQLRSEETAATSQAVESYDEAAATLELDLSILASSNLASVIHEHQEADQTTKTELSHQSTQLGIKRTAAAGEGSLQDQTFETEETLLTASGNLPDGAAATINHDTTAEGSKPFSEDKIDDPEGGSNSAV